MFIKDKRTGTWSLTIGIDPNQMPCIIGFSRGENPQLLTEGKVETDRLDGSMFDSDGCEKQLRVIADYQYGTLTFETLPEDEKFWEGTEHGQRIGMLGYYQHLLEEDIPNIEDYKEIGLEATSTHDEVFLWARSYALEDVPDLFEQAPSAPKP